MAKKTANQLFNSIIAKAPTIEEAMDELNSDLLRVRGEIEQIDPKFHIISVNHSVHFEDDLVVVTAVAVSSNEMVPVNR